MAENSAIQWTDHTFNPWRGCTKVHEGCTNCYAEVNYSVKMHGVKWGPRGTRVVAADSGWKQPLKWNREAAKEGVRKRVFCASLADVFEDWDGPVLNRHGVRMALSHTGSIISCGRDLDEFPLPDVRWATLADVRRRLFTLIDATPHLDWLVLTKRPENVRRMWPGVAGAADSDIGGEAITMTAYRHNVWLGTSVSLQEHADKQIPELLKCHDLCPVRFLSLEPLLGPVVIPETWLRYKGTRQWVIVGCESGPRRRVMQQEWAESVAAQCTEAGVQFFMKQMQVGSTVTGNVSQFPETLQVREFPGA